MNLRDAGDETLASIEAGNAVLLCSPSGYGKSQKAMYLFEKLKRDNPTQTWGFGCIFLATQTPSDLIGCQFKGEKTFELPDGRTAKYTVTDPSFPLWMLDVFTGRPACMFDRFFLLLEEYGQGDLDVKRAAAEIFLNGGTAPWYLPQGSVRVACTNEGARYGVSKDFDFCIARRTLIKISPSADVWLNDFADKPYLHQGQQWMVSPLVKACVKTHPQILFEKEPEKQGPWGNPRTITAADRYWQVKARKNNNVYPTDSLTVEHMTGIIGEPATQQLISHAKFLLELPSLADIVADPEGVEVPTKVDLKLLVTYMLAAYTKPDQLEPVITYIDRLKAKDMSVTFVSSLLRRSYREFASVPAMQQWIKKNAALVQLVSRLG